VYRGVIFTNNPNPKIEEQKTKQHYISYSQVLKSFNSNFFSDSVHIKKKSDFWSIKMVPLPTLLAIRVFKPKKRRIFFVAYQKRQVSGCSKNYVTQRRDLEMWHSSIGC
jgi:hypothetical protein